MVDGWPNLASTVVAIVVAVVVVAVAVVETTIDRRITSLPGVSEIIGVSIIAFARASGPRKRDLPAWRSPRIGGGASTRRAARRNTVSTNRDR